MIILAYFGPEVAMPLASLAAGLVGLVLMFWRRTVAGVKRACRRVTRLFGRSIPERAEAADPDRP